MSGDATTSAGATEWLNVYQDRLNRATTSDSPALQQHFRAEVTVIQATLKAMGISTDQSTPPPVRAVQSGSAAPEANPQGTPPVAGRTTLVQEPETLRSSPADNTPSALRPHRVHFQNASQETGVPANLLVAMAWQESRGVVRATSVNSNGLTDTGLLQVNPNTFVGLKKDHPGLDGDLNDPEVNIRAAAYYLSDMARQFGGDWKLALRAYNSGPNGVDRSNPDAIPAGTGDPSYVRKVTDFWSTLDAGTGSLPA